MGVKEPDKKKAITVKEITGSSIKTIPVGTKFTVTYTHEHWSVCQGININMIWNDEYNLVY